MDDDWKLTVKGFIITYHHKDPKEPRARRGDYSIKDHVKDKVVKILKVNFKQKDKSR